MQNVSPFFLAGLVLPLVASPVIAQTASALPPVPVAQNSPFAVRVAGRAAVSDGIFALTNASRLSVAAKWSVTAKDERNRETTHTGTESLLLDASANRVSLVSNTSEPAETLRFVSDGRVLLGTRFAASDKTRTFFRVPIEGDTETATEALLLAKAGDAPLTRVARTVLLSPLDNGGYGWRGRGDFVKQSDGAVIETLPTDANDRRVVKTVRRWGFDAKTRRPVRVEEWTTTENIARKTTRIVYRNETFVYAPFPTRTDLFVTKPTPGYAETPPPSGATLPDPPGPDEADTKARALLTRWERATARMTAYTGRVSVSATGVAQTPDDGSVAPRGAALQGTIAVVYEKPGKLFVTVTPDAAQAVRNASRPRLVLTQSQSVVADGTMLVVFDAGKKRGDSTIAGDERLIRQALRQNGFDDRAESLTWLFDAPRSVFGGAEVAAYRGALPLPGGGSAEAVTVRQTVTQNAANARRRRGNRNARIATTRQTTVTTTVYFDAATGLPRRIERFIGTTGDGFTGRDLPANRFFGIDYESVRLNEESSAVIFQIPRTP